MPVPAAISNLRLRMAFKGNAVDVMSCISTSNATYVYIIDDDTIKSSRIADSSDITEGGFTGHNPDNKDLYLLSIDNKLFSNVPGGIADCALFHTDIFSTIEFKTNAQGNTQESIEYTYTKAISQIEHTIEIFQQKLNKAGIDFMNHSEIVCHIIVSPKFPRSRAMEQNYALAFANRHEIELSFEDSRTY